VDGLAPAAPRGTATRRASSATRSTLETGLIAANKRPSLPGQLMRVRIRGVPLEGFELQGGRQQLRGDTVTVTVEPVERLVPRYRTVLEGPQARRMTALRPEPFIESDHPEMIATAQSIWRGQRDPRVVASRLVRWVRDSVRREPTAGMPGALHVLRTRRGDATELAQLFVALARASGVPARIVTGFVYADGKFYSHVWPEVMLRGWVAVDPTFGQLPADAGHLRFLSGGLGRQAELRRLAPGLTIDVLQTR
jgi:transglutaminase-like putative cysteine protease